MLLPLHYDGAPIGRHAGSEANNDLDDDDPIPHSRHVVRGSTSSAY
jgi:hypothetical protein